MYVFLVVLFNYAFHKYVIKIPTDLYGYDNVVLYTHLPW